MWSIQFDVKHLGRNSLSRLWPWRAKEHLFVACFPKSGSTYLCRALELLTGFPAGFVAEHGKHNDQNISARQLRRLRRRSVIQQHTQGTYNNLRLMREYSIRPVVHVRNLYDVVVSLYDHLKQEDHRVPTGYVHREYWRLGYAEQLDYLIHVHLPWYFNFMVSWHEASEQLPTLATRYEDLVADGRGVVQAIADFYHLPAEPAAIDAALRQAAGKSTRLNQGIVGRGAVALTTKQRAKIARLAYSWGVPQSVWQQIGVSQAA